MATNAMTGVGIFGLDGSTWAASAGFPLGIEQVKQVIAAISDTVKAQNGLQVKEDRYILVRSDPGAYLILKKGQNGIVANKSNQSVIIAIHDKEVKAEATLTQIGKVTDYLSRNGY